MLAAAMILPYAAAMPLLRFATLDDFCFSSLRHYAMAAMPHAACHAITLCALIYIRHYAFRRLRLRRAFATAIAAPDIC